MSETEKESKRKRREICSSSYPTWDDGLNGLSEASLRDLVRALDSKIDSVKNRIGVLKKQKQSTQNHHPSWDDVLNGISEASLRDLVRALDSKFDSVKNTIRVSEKQGQSTQNHHPGLPTIPIVSENQPLPITFSKPFNNHLPLFPGLDFGIKCYGNVGTADPALRGPETRRHLPVFSDSNFGIEHFENVGAADPAVSEVALASSEARHLPMVSDLGIGIGPYGNVGTSDLGASEVGLAGPVTSHLPMFSNLNYGIEPYRDMGTAGPTVGEVGLLGPETRHLTDFYFGIGSNGSVGAADPAASQFGYAGPVTSDLPELTECGMQDFYGDVTTSDQTANDICEGVQKSNEKLWMDDNDQMAMDNLDLAITQNSHMDFSLEKLCMRNFNDYEMGPVSECPSFNDSAVVNSPSYSCSEDYPSQNLLSSLPELPSNFSFSDSYTGFQKYF